MFVELPLVSSTGDVEIMIFNASYFTRIRRNSFDKDVTNIETEEENFRVNLSYEEMRSILSDYS